MNVEDLEEKIEQSKVDGVLPFFVAATAGTTVYGAFDPLNAIADVCEKHGLWFHVDVSELILVYNTWSYSSTLHPSRC